MSIPIRVSEVFTEPNLSVRVQVVVQRGEQLKHSTAERGQQQQRTTAHVVHRAAGYQCSRHQQQPHHDRELVRAQE